VSSDYTLPGLSPEDGKRVAELLQKRLSSYNDLHLSL
jgi:starvation-inducible DNA-binding protein